MSKKTWVSSNVDFMLYGTLSMNTYEGGRKQDFMYAMYMSWSCIEDD